MSYNTRRTGGAGFGPSPNAVGQRRPNPQGFQSQGQNQQSMQQQHMQPGPQQQQRIPQQSNQGINFRSQQQNQQQVPPMQQPQQAPIQQQQQAPIQQQQMQQQPQIQPQAQIPQMKQQQLVQQPKVEQTSDESMDTDGSPRKKPTWLNKGVKLSKRERQRRRNIRLRRILQPKNALMILNELVKNPTYTVSEVANPVDNNLYEATVVINDITHKGYGRSKLAAKTAAAEVALRHVIRYRRINEKQEDFSSTNGAAGGEAMEVTEEDVNAPLPWQHVASFALYKLFCSWGEDPNKARQEFVPPKHPAEPKPPKALPANAIEMNPNQLLNQMVPQVQYEEIGKSGNPPNVLFTIRCTANGENFIGTGRNKKLARKMAAFAACKKLFGLQYPVEVYPGVTA